MNLVPLTIRPSTIVPGNNEQVLVFDSTRFPSGPMPGASFAAGSAFLAPGLDRGQLSRAVVSVTAACTTQNVTIHYEVLTGVAGTSADWEDQGATGSQTVTAGTAHTFEFKPFTPDWRVRVVAGATGPGSLVVNLTVAYPTSDYGN